MSNRVYPRTVWVLMPSFKPVAVEVVRQCKTWGKMDGDYTIAGKYYSVQQMHETKESAIATGRYEIERLRASSAKLKETMSKHIAALDKAEGK